MPRKRRRKPKSSAFLIFRILRMTVLVPLTILFITEIEGPVIQEAVSRSMNHFSNDETAVGIWGIIILVNIILFLYLRPLLFFNKTCRRNNTPNESMRDTAAKVYNGLPKFILLITIAGFMMGALMQFKGDADDPFVSVPFIFIFLESLSTGFFAGMIMYISADNLLFPAKRLIFTEDYGLPPKYSSFYVKLILAITALVFFLFFQIFDSLTSFYLVGSAEEMIMFGEDGRFMETSELFKMSREHEGLKDVLQVLGFKVILFCFYVFHILREIKKLIQNPLDTVQLKLEGLNADNPEHSNQIDIVNNDEFTKIYREINSLIDKQNILIRSSEERLEKIVDQAADPIISFHENGAIHVFNPAAEAFFGYSEEEALTMNMADLVEKPEGSQEAFIKYLCGKENALSRFKGIHKDGYEKPFESNVSVHETDHGLHYTAIIRDVAGQIEFEENLKKAKTSAENANRMKSEFLANMSHELRTPLNAVLGFTQLLSTDKNLTGGQLDKINTISRSGEHLLALINDILDISKIESGKTEMHESVFDINRFVEDLKDMFILKCKTKGLTFYVEYAGELPSYVVGDLGKLRQIMINLIGNAVKFTNEGGVSLLVGEDNGRIRFSVNDTGKGIPDDEIGNILQPFVQSSNTDHEGGTGLGLAITNSFINLMGGEMSIDSELGVGSTFSFDVPLKESEEAPEEDEDLGTVLAIKGGRAVKALIVDDKVNNRLILKTMLERVGFVTMEAENGLQAIERTEEFDPEMIFMDIKMPVMDGYESVKRIKDTKPGKGITIFALTASAFRHDEKKIFESGFDGFLPKPFKLESLYKIITEKTEVDFIYDSESPSKKKAAASPDDLDFAAIAKSLSEKEIDQLDDNILINDFAAIKELVRTFTDREELAGLVEIIINLADNFNDDGLEELAKNIRDGLNG